ncbi:MobA/MobL family protein, partial [Acinetobacter sp. YH12129]|uniref:MobA/MobL family protein n=1 Tax=Acinetobacter sp. YH12129 TaxID=2601114 RepID=UPI0015D31BC8
MFYLDMKHNVKGKTTTTRSGKEKKAPTSRNGFFYITRTAHFRNGKEGEEVEWVRSGNMPDYAKTDPKQFWVNADKYEQEKGRTSSVMTIALPNNISKKERIELVEKFIDEFANKHGFAFTCAIHNHRGSIEGKDQPHLHFMYSERPVIGNEHLSPKQFFARYNAKKPERGGVRKLSADVLGFGKNHVNHVRQTTENLMNDFLAERAPTKKITIKGIEVEVPSFVSSLSNRDYNKKFGTNLKDVPQLPRWKVQSKDPKHQAEIAEQLEAIRAVREHNNMQLYGQYYQAELARRQALDAVPKPAAESQTTTQEQKPQTTWGAVADIDRLEEITRFNPDLLPTLQAISDFASYDVTQHLK